MAPGDASTDVPDSSTSPLDSDDVRETPEPVSPDAVQFELAEWGEEVKRRELQTAIGKLEASGTLTESDRAVLDAMIDRLVARLLSPPTAALDAAANESEADRREVLADLFEPIIDED